VSGGGGWGRRGGAWFGWRSRARGGGAVVGAGCGRAVQSRAECLRPGARLHSAAGGGPLSMACGGDGGQGAAAPAAGSLARTPRARAATPAPARLAVRGPRMRACVATLWCVVRDAEMQICGGLPPRDAARILRPQKSRATPPRVAPGRTGGALCTQNFLTTGFCE
jgi:hypothetical protein